MATDPLAEATRQLEEANRELDSITYGISHDLRSPLRAITGFAQMLQEDCGAQLDADGRRYLDVIRKSALKLEQLVAGILDYSRISRQPLHPGPVDMNALARRALAAAREGRTGPEPEIILQDLPEAGGDPDLLYYVWHNLLTNALTYTARSAAPRIEIGGNRGEAQTIWYVRDNGVGFDMRYASKLFGALQRLHSPEEFPGVGMGLAIVRRIVARHGGRVWAEAEPGRGASFFFSLQEVPMR